MINYFNQNQDQFWFVLGFGLLVMEIAVLGMGSGIALFAGVAALLTGTVLWVSGVDGWMIGIAVFAISTILSTTALWKPFRHLNDKQVDRKRGTSDFVGHTFYLDSDITAMEPGKTRFSGVDWAVLVAKESGVERISAGTEVTVVDAEVGMLRVVPSR